MNRELFEETFAEIDRLILDNDDLRKVNRRLKEKLEDIENLKKENTSLKNEIREKSILRDTVLEMHHNELILKAKKIKELESKIKEYEKPTMDLCECGD